MARVRDYTIRQIDGVWCVPQHIAAAMFGVSAPTFRAYAIEPVEHQGRITWYSLPDLRRAAIARAGAELTEGDELRQQRLRMAKLKADEVERALAAKYGTLLQPDAVQAAFDAVGIKIRERFDGLGQAVAPETLALAASDDGDVDTVAAIIQGAADAILDELSKLRFVVGGPGEAGEPDRQRVGGRRARPQS